MVIRFQIAELMHKKRATYLDIKEKTGISTNTLYKLRKGKAKMVGLDVIDRLLDYFNCEPNDLIARVKEEGNHATPE